MKMKLFYFFQKALLGIFLLFSGVAYAQSYVVSGTVKDVMDQSPLPGVSILVKGTTAGTTTDFEGKFTISVDSKESVLIFSFVGYRSQEVVVGDQSNIEVTLTEDTKSLEEVVVVGYTTQQKKDIIGSVSIVETKDLLAVPAGNVQQQLQGRTSGVTISGSGAPGTGAKVRIRGFGSFGSSDPLYVIDGVPTTDVNYLNPQDIQSMQILKDATAASIYGSRAANGVVIITTKQGKAGKSKISVDSYYGWQQVTKTYDLLNTEEYGDLLWRGYQNAGQTPNHGQYGSGASPVIPDYILAGSKSGVFEGDPALDLSKYNVDPDNGDLYQITRANKSGTDWYDAIFRVAPIQSHQLTATGGSEKGIYALGLNYFNQEGTLEYTGYKRYSVRANSSFHIKDAIRVGENLQLSYEDRQNGENLGEEGAIAMAYRMQPIIPVYDVMGNFAGSNGSNLGNAYNPLADLYRGKDNKDKTYRAFGNIYGEVDFLKAFTFRSSFGIDYTTRYREGFTYRTYERSENVGSNTYEERNDWGLNWTFTNTLQFHKNINNQHDVKVLLGSEAIKFEGRGVGGSRNNFTFIDPDRWILDRGEPRLAESFSYGNRSALFSLFGRLEYMFKGKYLLNATFRRDGSSKFGENNRYANFPAVGVGWRISEEPFMASVGWVSDLKLRAGWGKMGNQAVVPSVNQYLLYRSTPGNSGYDIDGTNTSVYPGYDLDRMGNVETKWESSTTTNIGVDASLFQGALDVSVEWYNRETEGLLVTRQAPLTAPHAEQPKINVGTMRNRGVDLMLTYRGDVNPDLRYEATVSFSHYKNEALKLQESDDAFFTGGESRFGDLTRTVKGQPVSSFYGYVIDGFFNSQEEINNYPDQLPIQKKIGGWRIKDLNGDNVIDSKDQTFIGSPHPDFQTGLNLSVSYKNFDLSAFLFWNYGNEIYHYNRWWMDFNSFQGNRSERMLYDSWTPDNPNAKLPILDATDNQSGNISSTYYIESGSYLRLKNLQIGYNLPETLLNKLGMEKMRVYVQGVNLFTATPYTGLDPDISIQNTDKEDDDAIQSGDLSMGVDRGVYPNSRQILLGLSLTF
ncbi:TonB-dependent receptor [Rapidithrix thailandica]|uniref:TonB-dependent receptor n=1 Tax=Rapidithrix thailandica TaxID=413964 RepID=A0AAW9S353_9BACT